MKMAKTKQLQPVLVSDLVMVQLAGRTDELVDMLQKGADINPFMKKLREEISNPNVADHIVDMCVKSQFGDPLAAFREVVQNARDAGSKSVDFEMDTDASGRVTVVVRDDGCGMTAEKVVEDLLVPFSSSKEKGQGKVGEKGIGWYSCLDLCDEISVYTVSGDEATLVKVYKEEGKWYFQMELSERHPNEGTGTRMVMRMRDGFSEQDVAGSLKEYAGYVHELDVNMVAKSEPEELEIDGGKPGFFGKVVAKVKAVVKTKERVNESAHSYEVGASVTVEGRGIQEELVLRYADRNSIREIPAADGNILIAQKGLLVSKERNPFPWNSVHHDLIWKMAPYIHIWLDLPSNVGLTKSRNGVSAEDEKKVKLATYDAFENFILEKVLTDEKLIAKMDSGFVEILLKILRGEYSEDERRKAYVEVKGKDHFYEERAKIDEIEEEKGDSAMRDMHGLAGAIANKAFIPAVIVENGEARETKISIAQMKYAYENGKLFNLSEGRGTKNGIYVDYSKKIVSELIKDFAKESEKKKRRGEEGYEDEEIRAAIMARVPAEVLRKVVEKYGKGQEYLILVECAEYIDELLEKACGVRRSSIMVREDQFEDDLAHTDRYSIAFNLAQGSVMAVVEYLAGGEIDEAAFWMLLEIIVHEEAHVLEGADYGYSAEGEKHYEHKERMVDQLLKYIRENNIDVAAEFQRIRESHEIGERISPAELGDLVDLVS